jgi:hypothetical protein
LLQGHPSKTTHQRQTEKAFTTSEPGLPDATRSELESANIQIIYLRIGGPEELLVLGRDQKFRVP